MVFGKRALGGVTQVPLSGARTGHRQVLGTALAGLIVGFGVVTAGTTLVHASERTGLFNFLEDLFRGPPPPPRPIVQPRAPVRYSSLPDARRVGSVRTLHRTQHATFTTPHRSVQVRAARPTQTVPAVGGTRTVCVRTCDGYVFPLGRLRSQKDLPVHETACAAACPNAPTQLFTLAAGRAEMDQAVSLKGQPYLASAWANVFRRKRVEDCTCQPPGIAATPLPIVSDLTLRRGDVVATEDSAEVVTRISRRGPVLADFREVSGLSRRSRRQIDDRVGTMRREAVAAEFRRAMRALEQKGTRIRVAEAGAARLRVEDVEDFRLPAEGRSAGFAPVRVVAASSYAP